MQIVIEISEEEYRKVEDGRCPVSVMRDAIRNGKPLSKGHWETSVDRWGEEVTTVNGYRCSECGEFNGFKDNFCPNCGADMRADKEREE